VIKWGFLLGRDQLRLDPRVESVDRHAVVLKALTIQSDRVGEDRIVEFGETVQGQISEVGNVRSKHWLRHAHNVFSEGV
jgi:hypothetical protein